jgi:hypothetical protein
MAEPASPNGPARYPPAHRRIDEMSLCFWCESDNNVWNVEFK